MGVPILLCNFWHKMALAHFRIVKRHQKALVFNEGFFGGYGRTWTDDPTIMRCFWRSWAILLVTDFAVRQDIFEFLDSIGYCPILMVSAIYCATIVQIFWQDEPPRKLIHWTWTRVKDTYIHDFSMNKCASTLQTSKVIFESSLDKPAKNKV